MKLSERLSLISQEYNLYIIGKDSHILNAIIFKYNLVTVLIFSGNICQIIGPRYLCESCHLWTEFILGIAYSDCDLDLGPV